MEVAGIPILKFVGFILIIIGLFFFIIGFATPNWYQYESLSVKYYAGLWKNCTSVSGTTTCSDFGDVPSWLGGVRAIEIIGFLSFIAALVVIILWFFVMKNKDMLKWIAVGCLGGSAFFLLLGVCIYAGETSDREGNNLHFSFAFVIIAALSAIAASVLFCIDKSSL